MQKRPCRKEKCAGTSREEAWQGHLDLGLTHLLPQATTPPPSLSPKVSFLLCEFGF